MDRLKPSEVGRMINDIRALAEVVEPGRVSRVSPDPGDDFLLAAARAGRVDFLVSGDRGGLLSLDKVGTTQVVTARFLADLLDG